MLLHIDGAWKQDDNRENDRLTMDEIIKEVTSTTLLIRLNDVRLHLKVTRLSDMATVSGDNIHMWLYTVRLQPVY